MAVSLKNEKNYGLIGSVLVLAGGFLGIIPYIGTFMGAISLVGQVLILLALKGIGDKLGDDRPFRYYLYSVIAGIAGLILAAVLVIIGALSIPSFVENGDSVSLVGISLLGTGLLVLLAAAIVGIYFTIRAWRATYELTGVEEFDKTATWLMWGAILAIVVIGLVLLLVAAVYQILAFANLPEELERSNESGTLVIS
ncbi:hypothetical protein APY94_05430 [Thermococcus celericrescens]|uniref:DUF996 domain-containing protein n=2 Tax=Thermococcus TaxID=2263 RepID=A0A100XY24_9EURY|nr:MULTISPECIES: DUF996 domain-containing protein [Thermococcus]KUH33636.1 hypothetical protein APY94_05430 [Thermococcus celericrescens]QEK14357.1 DUF996 domain-containing protein [Thermococcus aciditolerans]